MEAELATNIDDLYDKALDLSSNVEDNFLDLARSLRQLLDRDPDLFKKVIDKSNLGSRKAYYLVNISRWFNDVPVGKARLRKIGWTKLQVIGPHVTAQNVDELIELAENNTTAQLKQLMRGEQPLTNAHCVLMYFSPQQYEKFEDVLVKNGGTRSGRGILNKEEALIRALDKVK